MNLNSIKEVMKRIIEVTRQTSGQPVKENKSISMNEIKGLFSGDYNSVLNRFNTDYYYSLRQVDEELKNNKIIVKTALEKNIADLRFVTPEFISQTYEIHEILQNIYEKNPEKLQMKKEDIEVGAGTTLVLKGILYEQVESVNNLLNNKDYRKEFEILFPERKPKNSFEKEVDIRFLENNMDIYIKLNNAVKQRLEQENSQNKSDINKKQP